MQIYQVYITKMVRGRSIISSLLGWFSLGLLGFGFLVGSCNGDGLKKDFYKKSCPIVEHIVRAVTCQSVAMDPSMAAKLLRIHYHDCFVRGCDASLLLDTVNGGQPSEKEARPNLSVSGYEVFDRIKDLLEWICPETVSCADIVALAARDAVSFQFGYPLWEVPTGRRDGVVSLASEVGGNLPSPFANFTTLQQVFSSKGLDVLDLVSLSGAHTIGVSHCGAFSRRLYNFSGKGDTDPSLDKSYAEILKKKCPNPADRATVVEMDPKSSLSFDTHYFSAVKQHKGLFISDAALLTDPAAAAVVQHLSKPFSFFKQFGKSMQKMGDADVLTGNDGEIRRQCRVVNSFGGMRATA